MIAALHVESVEDNTRDAVANAALGVATINAGPAHPRTCDKIERWHQT